MIKTSKKVITGYVTAIDWDMNDTVSAISIEADGEEYIVEDEGLVEELLDFLDEEVEVTGIITEDGDGTKHIRITDYERLENDDDYDDNIDFEFENDESEDDFGRGKVHYNSIKKVQDIKEA